MKPQNMPAGLLWLPVALNPQGRCGNPALPAKQGDARGYKRAPFLSCAYSWKRCHKTRGCKWFDKKGLKLQALPARAPSRNGNLSSSLKGQSPA
eukprot:1146110-Pelagomonas_calceolata.AAC.5